MGIKISEIDDESNFLTKEEAREVFYRLISYLKSYKLRLSLGVFFGVLAGIINGVFLLVIKTVFTVVLPNPEDFNKESSEVLNKVHYPFKDISFLKDFSITTPNIPSEYEWVFVLIVCMSIPLLLLMRGIFQYLHSYFFLWINMNLLFRLRSEVFSSIINQSLSFFNNVKQGKLIQAVSNQTRTSVDSVCEFLSSIIKHPISIIAIVITITIMDPLYTFGALIVFPLCILPIIIISRKVRKSGLKEEIESENMMINIHESFSGIRLIKSNSSEEYHINKFNIANKKIINFIMRWKKSMELSGPLVEVVGSIGICSGIVYAWYTNMGVDTFTTINLGLISIYPHAKSLGKVHVHMQKCSSASRNVFRYIDSKVDVVDKENAIKITKFSNSIKFKDVDFSYSDNNNIIKNINFSFNKGKRYALVGQSGAGKSTLLSLILRFYDVSKGNIKIDGIDIKNYTQKSIRDLISFVSQDVFLFNDSISNNIKYTKTESSKEGIVIAAKMANAHAFIMSQKNKYETIIGDKGSNLSGGQQQRVSIARSILKKSPIIFLDEATSALDSKSEKIIRDSIKEFSKDKTVIAIAHRLSTILDSDEIIVMKDGSISDYGTHTELLSRSQEYYNIYKMQFE